MSSDFGGHLKNFIKRQLTARTRPVFSLFNLPPTIRVYVFRHFNVPVLVIELFIL